MRTCRLPSIQILADADLEARHLGVVDFAFCDGSTHTISVSIDSATHRYLGERDDGKVLDESAIGQ